MQKADSEDNDENDGIEKVGTKEKDSPTLSNSLKIENIPVLFWIQKTGSTRGRSPIPI